eukprot:scaffold320732_cov32-Tisochrysis_lutea.AAC.2
MSQRALSCSSLHPNLERASEAESTSPLSRASAHLRPNLAAKSAVGNWSARGESTLALLEMLW